MSNNFALIAFDTDRIKDYVFATDTLKEIRGASARLDELNRDLMPHLIRKADVAAQTIYAHGGGGLFLVAADKAEDARLAVEKAYRKYSGQAASVTGVMIAVPAGFDEQSSSQSLFKLLQFRLRQAKDNTPTGLSITSSPYLRYCDACGEFPAENFIAELGSERLLCQACRKRRHFKRGLWERLQSYGLPPGELPQDFSELSEFSKPSGYIGLLYADGNAMGREIESQPTLARIRQFAEAVDNAMYQAVRDAIQTHLAPLNNKFPCVPLLLGGDDLVMVTQAQSAIDVAITLTEKFGDYTEQQINKRLSISVGVVLAHANFPFRTMLDLAESALKFAKTEAVKRSLKDRSLINFLTVTSANHLDFKSFYTETLKYQLNPQAPIWLRTRRPYAPADLRRLVETVRKLKDAPRGRLQALGNCVFLTPPQAMLEGPVTLMRWRGNSEDGPNAQQVKEVMNLVQQPMSNIMEFPWNRRTPGNRRIYDAPLFDLAELFDFVKDG